MKNRRKFSIFISSTYEDLKKERQALVGVALENNFIPVGMEQFHAAPTSQWNVITKMIDECDFYLLVIGARYGSIDEETGISYTEKEYNYAKTKGLRTLGSPTQIFTSGKQFMADNSKRESARWEEALDRLIEWGWVKAVGYKGEIFELTGTGYSKADWLKNNMAIDTSKEPLDELKEFED